MTEVQSNDILSLADCLLAHLIGPVKQSKSVKFLIFKKEHSLSLSLKLDSTTNSSNYFEGKCKPQDQRGFIISVQRTIKLADIGTPGGNTILSKNLLKANTKASLEVNTGSSLWSTAQ